jgi:hypothetical protein
MVALRSSDPTAGLVLPQGRTKVQSRVGSPHQFALITPQNNNLTKPRISWPIDGQYRANQPLNSIELSPTLPNSTLSQNPRYLPKIPEKRKGSPFPTIPKVLPGGVTEPNLP